MANGGDEMKTYYCPNCDTYDDVSCGEQPERWHAEGCDGMFYILEPGMTTTVYANVYGVAQCYGGPEEGGWWYDTGYPLASVPFTTEAVPGHGPNGVVIRYSRKLPEQVQRVVDSVIAGNGEHNPRLYVETKFAHDWPISRPYYE